MRSRLLAVLVATLGCLSLAIVFNGSARSPSKIAVVDGTCPPHAVDTDGSVIPDSSATRPKKPIIFAKDSKGGSDKTSWELKPEAAFDHAKHSDNKHTVAGQSETACVYCHHTEQPTPVPGAPYLVKSERKEVLTANLLEAPNAQPVNSCRHCHFQTEADSPPMVKYPSGKTPDDARGERFLTNRVAYHIRCISCHFAASNRDPKPPTGCVKCHQEKAATPTPTVKPAATPIPTATPQS